MLRFDSENSRKKPQHGFTLIELLIVVVVIGALAGITVSVINPSGSQGRARDGARLSNVKAISEAVESYRLLEGIYPETADALDENSLLRTTYLQKWPAAIADNGEVDEENWNYVYAKTDNGFVTYTPNSIGGCFKYQSTWSRVLTCPVASCSADETDSEICVQ